ncbi:MAG: hypothetical protein ACTTIM_02345 [Campylobacter sp.]
MDFNAVANYKLIVLDIMMPVMEILIFFQKSCIKSQLRPRSYSRQRMR